MKKHIKNLSFKDFKLNDSVINNSVFSQYYCKNGPIEWDIILKHYGNWENINQVESWTLEVWTGGKGSTMVITLEEENKDPEKVINAFNKIKHLIYKMYQKI